MNAELLRLYSHPYIQGKREIWIDGDKYITPPSTFAYRYCSACDAGCDDVINPRAIWLPPLWSDDDPGRSLIGMLGKDFISLEVNPPEWTCVIMYGSYYTHVCHSRTPTMAVLKAIWEQQEEA